MSTKPTEEETPRRRHDIVVLNDPAQAKAHQARVDAGEFDVPEVVEAEKPAKSAAKAD